MSHDLEYATQEAMADNRTKSISRRQNSTCKGPEAGACLAHLRKSKETSVAGVTEGERSKG